MIAVLAYGPGEALGVLHYVGCLDRATGQRDRLPLEDA